jgi:hypothetical protein
MAVLRSRHTDLPKHLVMMHNVQQPGSSSGSLPGVVVMMLGGLGLPFRGVGRRARPVSLWQVVDALTSRQLHLTQPIRDPPQANKPFPPRVLPCQCDRRAREVEAYAIK